MSETVSHSKKDETYWKVLDAAVELDFRKGHQKWTITDLARKSGITRSLIYYYFGRSKAGILNEAIRLLGEELAGLNPQRVDLWKKGNYLESIRMARNLVEKAPHICQFFFTHRQSSSETGDTVRKMEKEFLIKIGQFFPRAGQGKVLAIYAVYLGAVFAPEMTEEAMGKIIEMLMTQQLA